MHFHAALFDMDGTLVDSERVVMNAWLQASREVGAPLDADQYARVIGLNNEESNELLVSFLGGTDTFLSVRLAARRKLLARNGTAAFALKPGAHELLGALCARGVRCAVASSSTSSEIKERLSHAGILHFFHATAGGNEVPRGKPDPAVYQLAAARLGVAPSNCIAFEDSEHGAASAAAAGAQVVLVPDLTAPSSQVTACVSMVLRSLAEAVPWVNGWFPARADA